MINGKGDDPKEDSPLGLVVELWFRRFHQWLREMDIELDNGIVEVDAELVVYKDL
jgi:hypothetical protein